MTDQEKETYLMDMDGFSRTIYVMDDDGGNKEPLLKLTFEFSPCLDDKRFGKCQDIFYKAFNEMRKQFNIE